MGNWEVHAKVTLETRWEETTPKINIRMGLRDAGWEAVECIHIAQDRPQWRAHINTVINLRIAYKTGDFLTS
jgi:hypothetical protein